MVAGSDRKYDLINIIYDSNGSPIYFVINPNGHYDYRYYYEKNLQGDIIGLLDEDGHSVVQYAYDEWGKVISVTGTLAESIGNLNPLRYRGYYYDTETGLYYLQSRYYDPAQMRFISQDDPTSSNAQGQPLGSNLYAYCLNNPVNGSDPTGHILIPIIVTALAVALVVTFRLSIAMYMYAITGSHFKSKLDLSAWYNPLGILLRNRLTNSKFVLDKVKQMIKKGVTKKSYDMYFGDKGGNIADLDLSMSVGHATLSFCITKTSVKRTVWVGKTKCKQTKYIVQITIKDRYDFKLLSKDEAGIVKRAINNYLGYYPQEWKVLKPYDFAMTYSFDYFY